MDSTSTQYGKLEEGRLDCIDNNATPVVNAAVSTANDSTEYGQLEEGELICYNTNNVQLSIQNDDGSGYNNTLEEGALYDDDKNNNNNNSDNDNDDDEDNNYDVDNNNNNNDSGNNDSDYVEEEGEDDDIEDDDDEFEYKKEEEGINYNSNHNGGEVLSQKEIEDFVNEHQLKKSNRKNNKTWQLVSGGDCFGDDCVVEKGRDLEMDQKPKLGKDKMKKGEDDLKISDPGRYRRKHPKQGGREAADRAVQVKHGYASENDPKYILPGDDDSLEEWKKSIIHKFRRFLDVLKVPMNEWNNYEWNFDMDKDENGTNEGEKRGILVWDKKKNIHFNCIISDVRCMGHIKVSSELIQFHLDREFDDSKKCNCGCGYSERDLQSLGSANKIAFSNHWRNQDIKKDYISMSEDIYYNKGGREKLLALKDSDKIYQGRTVGLLGSCYEGIYWVKKKGEDTRKMSWTKYLSNVSSGFTSVSKNQLERLNDMKVPLKQPIVFD